MITIIIIVTIIILIVVFFLFILPLFKYASKISHNIREAVLPGLLELDKTIITICSAAIILTIHLIDKPVVGKNYLIASWFGLIVCIGIGVIILLACYTHRITERVLLSQLKIIDKERKNMNENEKDLKRKEVRKIFNHQVFLNKVRIILIYLLVSSLLVSFLFMTIFGSKNL